MNHPNSGIRLCQGSNDTSGRKDPRQSAVSQMMAENREGLGMKVIAVMVQRYGVLPKELWDLNSVSDMGAGRGITYDEKVPQDTFASIISNDRYNIINLSIKRIDHKVELPSTLRFLSVLAQKYDYPMDLPTNLQELRFDWPCQYNQPLVFPTSLHTLIFGISYNQPLTLPPQLLRLELGYKFNHPLSPLPQHLKHLAFLPGSPFNFPLALPASLLSIKFGVAYNKPIVLPYGIEEVRFGSRFAQDLSLPNTLRKIKWGCNRPIQIPEGVVEVELDDPFDKEIHFPSTLKKLMFGLETYTHPVTLPDGLEDLVWYPTKYDSLVLPEGLQKLAWSSESSISLPPALKELVIEGPAPLVLPDGLLKVTFDYWYAQPHYNLPESVREVKWLRYSNERVFIHPSTLPHLIINFGDSEVDLSSHRIHKLTIGSRALKVKLWPQELKELEFTVDDVRFPLRVPKGCRLVGDKRPEKVIME